MHPLIFVSYHKRAPILPVNWIIPIHVGRKVAHESSKDSSYLSEADKTRGRALFKSTQLLGMTLGTIFLQKIANIAK